MLGQTKFEWICPAACFSSYYDHFNAQCSSITVKRKEREKQAKFSNLLPNIELYIFVSKIGITSHHQLGSGISDIQYKHHVLCLHPEKSLVKKLPDFDFSIHAT